MIKVESGVVGGALYTARVVHDGQLASILSAVFPNKQIVGLQIEGVKFRVMTEHTSFYRGSSVGIQLSIDDVGYHSVIRRVMFKGDAQSGYEIDEKALQDKHSELAAKYKLVEIAREENQIHQRRRKETIDKLQAEIGYAVDITDRDMVSGRVRIASFWTTEDGARQVATVVEHSLNISEKKP